MTASHSTTRPDDSKRKLDLSLTQIASAALAAVTAAVLGSRLGSAGTLIGAAGASVITSVATAVYRASLERSRARVRVLAHRTRPLPIFREGPRTEPAQPAEVTALPGDEQLTGSTSPVPRTPDRFRRFATLRWGAVIVGTLGAFVLAMMVITGFEQVTGETLAGDREGTTIGRVINAPAPQSPTVPSAPPSASLTPSATPTATVTTAPESTASTEPSPSNSSTTPTPSGPNSPAPVIPTRLPGVGD